jgi:small subunit ribosomal protein S6
MVIFDVDLEEGDIRQRIERVHEIVRSKGGVPGSVSHWGRRTFAYEIKHRTDGYYVVLEATAEPAAMSEVDRFLALEDAVLRHKVIRQPDHVAGRTASQGRKRPAPNRAPSSGSSRPAASRGAATQVSDGNVSAAPAAPVAVDTAEKADTDAGTAGDSEAS